MKPTAEPISGSLVPRKPWKWIVLGCACACLLSACRREFPPYENGLPLTAEQRLIADQCISVFENGEPTIQYAYIENIHDGRGYTAGRAGFTTRTCDLLEVLRRYDVLRPGQPIAAHIPLLESRCTNDDSSVVGLESLPADWVAAAADSVFLAVQDAVVDEYYFQPAYAYALELELHMPLSLLNLYDACIQHGDGDDPDGLGAMIERTNKKSGGSPADGRDEKRWLDNFMKVRRATLRNPDDESTQEAWRESVYRVDALRGLFDDEQYYLTSPLHLNVWETDFYLPE
ncbi:MAG: chitosanase [Bacteroidia bacterium]